MLVWINGPNGVGKTQVAHELHRRLPASFVSDPEHVGFALRRMRPAGLRVDFRTMPLWRHAVHESLNELLHSFNGPVIVPMTITDPDHHEELTGRLRAAGHDVHHFALLAARETLLRRI